MLQHVLEVLTTGSGDRHRPPMGAPRPCLPATHAVAILAAVCLLALVGGAAAQCGLVGGQLKLELVTATNAGSAASMDWFRICLPAFIIRYTAGCDVSIQGVDAVNSFVPSIWASYVPGYDHPVGTQPRTPRACPTAQGPTIPGTALNIPATIRTALERYVYGSTFELGSIALTWPGIGVAEISSPKAGPFPASGTLRYAVTDISDNVLALIDGNAQLAQCDTLSLRSADGECVPVLSAANCGAGRREVGLVTVLGAYEICPYCKAGTHSAGTGANSCTGCAVGTYFKGLGNTASGSCTACPAGYYNALTGASECQPCPENKYRGTAGATAIEQCLDCPAGSFAYWPGSSHCMHCVNGAPACAAGSHPDGVTPCTSNPTTSSEGYHVLSITTVGTLGTCTSPAPPVGTYWPLLTRCTSLLNTYLSLYVMGDCSVTVFPTREDTCSEPLAGTSRSTAVPPYTYSSGWIGARYVSIDRIATTIDLTVEASAFAFTLDSFTGSTLAIRSYSVTSALASGAVVSNAVSGGTSAYCTDGFIAGIATVLGPGPVARATDANTFCPAGSYRAADGCRPCPVGHYCSLTDPATVNEVTTPQPCPIDTFNPYLGQTASSDCLTCVAIGMTSLPGADYCAHPDHNTACDAGQEYSDVTRGCTSCPAGTSRSTADEAVCVSCPMGQYSGTAATNCVDCPVGQYSDIYGLPVVQSSGTQKCLLCPAGEVPQTDAGLLGQLGSTSCSACGAGTQPNAVTGLCDACTPGTFRNSSSSATTCQLIPPGFKALAATPLLAIEPCEVGTASFYTGGGTSGARVPTASPTTCSPCTSDHTYSPRKGMGACAACPAGTYPTNSGSAAGNDQCSKCFDLTSAAGARIRYRTPSDTTGVCAVCQAGREVGGSGHRYCLPCAPGFYNPAWDGTTNDATKDGENESCQPCPINTYSSAGGSLACTQCPAGESTDGPGGTACEACPLGFYSPKAETPCVSSPRGNFVGTTGATTFSPCPRGTFSSDRGMAGCEPCGPGEYSSIVAAKACQTCPMGTWSMPKASRCTPCRTGHSSPLGSRVCSACKPGTLAPNAGTPSCNLCPRGFQCPTSAMRTAQPCPRGHFNNTHGRRMCTPCPINTFTSTTGTITCGNCPSSETTRGLVGQSACFAFRRYTWRRLLGTWG